jgi:transposase
VEGPWIFGMVNDKNEARLFYVARRNAATLVPLIKRHVAHGATICSDEWGAYTSLQRIGYQHDTVNHQKEYVNERGHHTQRIEGKWANEKTRILRQRHISDPDVMPKYLAEIWWRSIHRTRETRFEEFLHSIHMAMPLSHS